MEPMEVPKVAIDLGITQKYVLLTLHRASHVDEVFLRGLGSAEFHINILEANQPSLLALGGEGSTLSCPGGGRITFIPPNTYRIHGYSVGFGRADHATSAKLLKAALLQATVTHDDEGY